MVQFYMLASMCNELQRQHEVVEPRAMLLCLMVLFVEHSRNQRYEISKSLFKARMVESSLIQSHVLKMIEWIERLTVPISTEFDCNPQSNQKEDPIVITCIFNLNSYLI